VQTAAASLSTPAASQPARVRTRPAARLLGIHPLLGVVVSFQIAILAFDVISFQVTGLRLAGDLTAAVAGLVALFALWGYFVWAPGRQAGDWVFAETFLTLALFLQLGLLVGPGQYGAAALNRPLIDGWLAAADASLGVHVPDWAMWTRQHPLIATLLVKAYFTLLPQFFAPFLLLGLVYRDRRALWEFTFHFHVAAFVTVACFALWPAACAFTYYGFESVIDQARFIRHFNALRDGTLTTVTLGDIEGLVSFPSFHVAGAMVVTWVFRHRRWCLAVLFALNVPLIAATVMSGAHYLIDIVASGVLLAASIWSYRRLSHLIEPKDTRA
jgi:hypothetical protein